jgi:hypothetical protein
MESVVRSGRTAGSSRAEHRLRSVLDEVISNGSRFVLIGGDAGAGQVDGTTTAAAWEIRELKRKNAELEQTVAILKAATAFNACGESARNTDHLYSRRRASCSGLGRADLPRAESAWLPDRPEPSLHGPAGRRRNETCGISSSPRSWLATTSPTS